MEEGHFCVVSRVEVCTKFLLDFLEGRFRCDCVEADDYRREGKRESAYRVEAAS